MPRPRKALVVVPVLLLAVAGCHRPLPLDGTGEGGASLPPGATLVTGTPALAAPPPAAAPAPASAIPMAGTAPASFAPIAKRADPSVVTIKTLTAEPEESPFPFMIQRRRRISQGLGTGFVFDKSGIILTNNHVVEGAQEIEVQLSDRRIFPAKVVGTDRRTDIAVVRIDAKGLRPLPLGDSDAIEVGDWVVAIGNPYGLSHTVSAGIISAKGRTEQDVPLDQEGIYDFLQTDASINPGNSGGPLLNLRGEVVGMNSATRRGGAEGISFAIPINMIKQLLPMLLRDGHVTRSALGVIPVDVDELSAEDRDVMKLKPGDDVHGAVIAHMLEGGAASKAGLQVGDIILAFEGRPIERKTQLQWLASTAGVGSTVPVRVWREGKVFDIDVTLGKLPEPQQDPAGAR